MNYYYIGKEGEEETGWAVIYYISYLYELYLTLTLLWPLVDGLSSTRCCRMKTLMLFLTIILVGSGWTFIKHVFSDKEKKLFLVAIPLQLLFYIAQVWSCSLLSVSGACLHTPAVSYCMCKIMMSLSLNFELWHEIIIILYHTYRQYGNCCFSWCQGYILEPLVMRWIINMWQPIYSLLHLSYVHDLL